jgi:hypothetical protein
MRDDSLWDKDTHGVDDLDVGPRRATNGKRRSAPEGEVETERLIGAPLWWFNAVFPIVRSKSELAVALYLWRRRVVCGGHKTFDVPNGELKSLGISRYAKYRTLDRLSAAGAIRSNSKGKEAHTVTILLQKPKGKSNDPR